MNNTAFQYVSIDERRTTLKPRKSGLTMVSDYQLGMNALEDLIEVAGEYIDMFKFATGTSRLFDKSHLINKIKYLKENSIQTFLGGQFQEYVIHNMGFDAMRRHIEEANELGFDIIEISENLIEIDKNQRNELYALVAEAGLSPVGEVGKKFLSTNVSEIIHDIKEVLDGGAEFALIEAAELMIDGHPNESLIAAIIAEVSTDRCIFELATPRVGQTTVQIYEGKKFLIQNFGPDVNLGNVTPDLVIETETTRLGLGSAGPLDFPKSEHR